MPRDVGPLSYERKPPKRRPPFWLVVVLCLVGCVSGLAVWVICGVMFMGWDHDSTMRTIRTGGAGVAGMFAFYVLVYWLRRRYPDDPFWRR